MPANKEDKPPFGESPRLRSGLTLIEWVIVLLIIILLAGLLLPAFQPTRGPHLHCHNKLKFIGLALELYHEEHGSYPPAYVADANGTPLYSWRVLLLPYIERKDLYDDFDKTKPWDAPENLPLLKRLPGVYQCGAEEWKCEHTGFVGLFGKDCFFTGSQGRSIASISDGTANTLVVMESVNTRIPWTSPKDLDALTSAIARAAIENSDNHHRVYSGQRSSKFWALYVNGYFPKDLPMETWKLLCTVNDGQEIQLPKDEP